MGHKSITEGKLGKSEICGNSIAKQIELNHGQNKRHLKFRF